MKCGDPSKQINDSEDAIQVVGYSDPAVEGTTIMLECSLPDMVLTGPSRIICADNGLWQPNPRQTACRSKYIIILALKVYNEILVGICAMPSLDSDVISWRYNLTSKRSVIHFWCNESPDQVLIAVCSEDGIWSLNLNNFVHCRPSMLNFIMNLNLNEVF